MRCDIMYGSRLRSFEMTPETCLKNVSNHADDTVRTADAACHLIESAKDPNLNCLNGQKMSPCVYDQKCLRFHRRRPTHKTSLPRILLGLPPEWHGWGPR